MSRRNEIWRPWERHHTGSIRNTVDKGSTVTNSCETNIFSGFEEAEIMKFGELNKRKLVLHRGKGISDSFEGFEAFEVRKCCRINKHRINNLKRVTQREIDLPINNDQIILKTLKTIMGGPLFQ